MLNAKLNDGKNLALIFVLDNSGCSHYRLRWNALYYGGHEHLGFVPVLCPYPIFDVNYLAKAKALIFQRPCANVHVELIKRYKALQSKFGYKMVWECDDQVFLIDGEGIPKYNTASFTFNGNAVTEVCKKVLPLFDEVVVSTDYLKKTMERIFDIHNVSVIRNAVPRFLWSYPRKEHIKEDIVKPTVLYSGSPCHYRNPIPPREPSPQEPYGFGGISGLKGDMENAWCDWVIKNVREDKINFVVMGALPWFWACIREKITFIPWVDCNSFPRQVMETKADFAFGCLVDNAFNKCKSSLRFTESCAAGQVFFGTVFSTNKDSPYEEAHPETKVPDTVTVQQLDDIFWKLTKKDTYNRILDWQYDHINEGGYWLESDKHCNQWLEMIDNQSVCRTELI